MPSKRNSTAAESRSSNGSHRTTEPAKQAGSTATRPSPTPRTSRGAATVHAPRKAELGQHRVPEPSRPLPTHDQIACRAYEIWQLTGCTTGRDSDNWLQAERELSAGCVPVGSSEVSAHQA
jgi:hypothetical protein